MGDEIEKSTEISLNPIKDYFHELYSWAIQLGMTYEQFWEYDPMLINDFIKAEEIRQQKRNNEMWLQGMYNLQAILHCFSKKAKYPKQPIPITEREVENKREQNFQALYDKLLKSSQKK